MRKLLEKLGRLLCRLHLLVNGCCHNLLLLLLLALRQKKNRANAANKMPRKLRQSLSWHCRSSSSSWLLLPNARLLLLPAVPVRSAAATAWSNLRLLLPAMARSIMLSAIAAASAGSIAQLLLLTAVPRCKLSAVAAAGSGARLLLLPAMPRCKLNAVAADSAGSGARLLLLPAAVPRCKLRAAAAVAACSSRNVGLSTAASQPARPRSMFSWPAVGKLGSGHGACR